MKVIITIKLHFSMVVACFILSEFLKTSLAKLTAFEWKRAKRQVFAPDNYVQTSHSAPFNTYPGIFESTTFLIRIKKNSTSTGIRIQTDSLDSSELSSQHRFHVFESSCLLRGTAGPSVVSSIPFDGCYVFASFSCLRVVRFSFRRLCYIFSLELFETLHFF